MYAAATSRCSATQKLAFHEKACQQENPLHGLQISNESQPSRFHPHSCWGLPFTPVHENIRWLGLQSFYRNHYCQRQLTVAVQFTQSPG
jgi:hypothetical protein